MPYWSMEEGQVLEEHGVDEANTRGTVVAVGTSHSKGSWVEIVPSASNLFDAQGFWLHLNSTLGKLNLLDIGIGATEKILVPDIAFSGRRGLDANIYLPISIPKGAEINVRAQASDAQNIHCAIHLMSQGFMPGQPLNRCTAYGIVSASSKGTLVNPDTTAHTKGAWVELEDSTANPMRAMAVMITKWQDAPGYYDGTLWLMDVAIGAGGSEKLIAENIVVSSEGSYDAAIPAFFGVIPCNVPAGSRLAVRTQCSFHIDDAEELAVSILGFD